MSPARFAYFGVLALTLGLYGAMFGWSLPLIQTEAGGLAPFDQRLHGYRLEEAQAFLSALSQAGRAQYLGGQMQLDAIAPSLLFICFGFGIWHLLAGVSLITRVSALGIAAAGMVFDGLENMAVRALLLTDPADVVAADVEQASLYTVMKMAAYLVVGMVLVATFVVRSLYGPTGAANREDGSER